MKCIYIHDEEGKQRRDGGRERRKAKGGERREDSEELGERVHLFLIGSFFVIIGLGRFLKMIFWVIRATMTYSVALLRGAGFEIPSFGGEGGEGREGEGGTTFVGQRKVSLVPPPFQ